MGRPALYDAPTLVHAAQQLAAAGGPGSVTIAAVAMATGAPVGSIYHRFGSRDSLMAAAWLDALAEFQAGFIATLHRSAPQPALAAALFTTSWARSDATRARLLVLHRARDYGAGSWGDADRARARLLSDDLEAALAAFCLQQLGGTGGEQRRLATFALLDLPYAAVRRYLAAGITPPAEVDGYLATAVSGLLPHG
ncbi:MAG: TetR family transcriptional regulator [Candidatus Dormibacteria bacterium]